MITIPQASAHVQAAQAPAAPRRAPAYLLTTPFTIIIDTREQAPYDFANIKSDLDTKNRPIIVQHEHGTLKTGDYSIKGMEGQVCVERKSFDDLWNSVGQGRERFEREHERMAEMVAAGGFCCVIVEASVEQALLHPPLGRRLSPKTIDRTRLSWMLRYRVPWLFEDCRRRAEITTFRLLEFAWKHRQEDGWLAQFWSRTKLAFHSVKRLQGGLLTKDRDMLGELIGELT